MSRPPVGVLKTYRCPTFPSLVGKVWSFPTFGLLGVYVKEVSCKRLKTPLSPSALNRPSKTVRHTL